MDEASRTLIRGDASILVTASRAEERAALQEFTDRSGRAAGKCYFQPVFSINKCFYHTTWRVESDLISVCSDLEVTEVISRMRTAYLIAVSFLLWLELPRQLWLGCQQANYTPTSP